MKESLKNALPFAEGIARLLRPFAEVVVHDLEKDSVCAIYNPLSKRDVGSSSYLDRINFDTTETVIGPYDKTNWDGRPLKSISIVLRDTCGEAQGFLCVNLDVSQFQTTQNMLMEFLGNNLSMQIEDEKLFRDDLYEQINVFIQEYCRDNQTSLNALSRQSKKDLMILLEKQGAFKGKNAALYVSKILGISRATVYNYLKGE